MLVTRGLAREDGQTDAPVQGVGARRTLALRALVGVRMAAPEPGPPLSPSLRRAAQTRRGAGPPRRSRVARCAGVGRLSSGARGVPRSGSRGGGRSRVLRHAVDHSDGTPARPVQRRGALAHAPVSQALAPRTTSLVPLAGVPERRPTGSRPRPSNLAIASTRGGTRTLTSPQGHPILRRPRTMTAVSAPCRSACSNEASPTIYRPQMTVRSFKF